MNMLKFYAQKLGTTALTVVCLGTFSSGSVYGMDDQSEDAPQWVAEFLANPEQRELNKELQRKKAQKKQEARTDDQKKIVRNLFNDKPKYVTLMFQELVNLKDTPQQTFFLNQIFEKNKEFEEKKKLSGQNTLSSELKIEDNPIIYISPQPFITNEIEEISSHNIIEKKPQDFYVQKDEKRDL
jgi:hypothetical protein